MWGGGRSAARWRPSPCWPAPRPRRPPGRRRCPAIALRSTSAPSAGSGIFGRWFVDGFGLPAYRYRLDPDRDPRTRQPELDGSTDAWHQLGNDHIVATAHTRGHVQLWSQDRAYQWVNLAEPAAGQHAGGYGYLRTAGGRVISTLYADRPAGARTRRDFATGYFGRLTAARGVAVRERVYAPFGDDPVLLHDVTIRNTSRRALRASWFEYWGVNPRSVVNKRHLGLGAAGLRQSPAHAVGGRAAGRRRLAPADRVRRRPARPGGRLGDRRRALLRRRRPRAARRGRGRAPVAHARAAARRRLGGPAPVRVPRAGGRASRALGDAALRLRAGARPARSRARQALARRAGAARPQPERLEGLAAARAPRRRPRLALARAAVGRLHAALGGDLRGDLRAPHRLPGRLLPVRARHPGGLPRSASAHPAADLRRPRAGARDDPLLGRGAVERPRVPALLDHRDVPADRARHVGRPRPVAAAGGGRVRPRHPRPVVLRRAPAVGGRRLGVALAPPEAGPPQPGEPPRPARRVRRRHERRLVRLLDGDPRHGRVDARDRAAGLRLPAAGRAGRGPRRPRLRRRAARRRRRAARRAGARVDRARLVLARVRRPRADRPGRDLRRAAAVGAAGRRREPRPGAHAGGEHPPLPHGNRRAAADRRAGAHRLVAVARAQRPGRDRAHRAADRHRRQQRGLRGRRLVRDQRLADLGARRARRRGSAGARSTPSTSSSATRSPPTRAPSRGPGTA